jgi:hypothetical protein
LRHLVVSTPQFEGKDGLHIFPFKQEFVIQPCGEVWGVFEGGFLGDIIDTSRQDLYQVVAEHGVKEVSRCICKENFTLLEGQCCGGESAIAPAKTADYKIVYEMIPEQAYTMFSEVL